MKRYLFIISIFFACSYAISQSVSITCLTSQDKPLWVEVGDTIKFIGTWTANGHNLVGFVWNIPFNGEHDSGVSGIEGSTDGDSGYDPVQHLTTVASDTIYVIWGDGDWNEVVEDQVSVYAKYTTTGVAGEYFTNPEFYDVNVLRIFPPFITGANSIQQCCTTSVQYCDESNGYQDDWDWTFTGGTQTNSDGDDCASVTPNNTGNITVSVTATRDSNTNGYFRTSNKTVNRFQPVTPAITGLNYICKGGSELSLCTQSVCGAIGIYWATSSTDLSVYNGQGNTCATFRPNNFAANGTVVTVTAQAQFSGGCTATIASYNITIYEGGTPPTPSGTVTINLPGNYDPCSEEQFEYVMQYNGSYANGQILIHPLVVIDVPHHHLYDQYDVEVCFRNLCGGGQTCRTYHVYLPAPCVEDPIVNQDPQDSAQLKLEGFSKEIDFRNTYSDIIYNDLYFYPNPGRNIVSAIGLKQGNYEFNLIDVNGKIVYTCNIEHHTKTAIDLSGIKENGIYFGIFRGTYSCQYGKIILQN